MKKKSIILILAVTLLFNMIPRSYEVVGEEDVPKPTEIPNNPI